MLTFLRIILYAPSCYRGVTMKKQELIHLHGLLAEVCDHYEALAETDVTREEYETLGIQPTSIHKSKTDHKEAVFALAHGITGEMETEEPEPIAAD
jgi:hypothetical protein